MVERSHVVNEFPRRVLPAPIGRNLPQERCWPTVGGNHSAQSTRRSRILEVLVQLVTHFSRSLVNDLFASSRPAAFASFLLSLKNGKASFEVVRSLKTCQRDCFSAQLTKETPVAKPPNRHHGGRRPQNPFFHTVFGQANFFRQPIKSVCFALPVESPKAAFCVRNRPMPWRQLARHNSKVAKVPAAPFRNGGQQEHRDRRSA